MHRRQEPPQRGGEIDHRDSGDDEIELALEGREQLARERRVRQLDGRDRPRDRVPVAHGHAVRVPRDARPHEVVVRVVQRAPDSIEVREQQVAVDEVVDALVAGALLQRLQGVADLLQTSEVERLAGRTAGDHRDPPARLRERD